MASNAFGSFSCSSVSWRARGATSLEFAIILPAFMLLILAVVDFSRLFAIQSMLQYGAWEGAKLTRTIPNLDVDYRGKDTNNEYYRLFAEARRRVINAAERFPLSNSFITDKDTPSMAQLLAVKMVDHGLTLAPAEAVPSTTRGAAMLRPGEEAVEVASGKVIEHYFIKAGAGGIPPPQSPEQLLAKYPVQIVLSARVQCWLPVLGEKVLTASSLGYREMYVPKGYLEPEAGAPVIVIPGVGATTTTTTTTSTTTTLPWVCDPHVVPCFNAFVCGGEACCAKNELRVPGLPMECVCDKCALLYPAPAQ